jgi:hypothetical protein
MVEYVNFSEINDLKDKDYFIVEFDFHDTHVPTNGPYDVKFAILKFDDSDLESGSENFTIRIPNKRRIVELLKDIIKEEEMKPLFMRNNVTISDPRSFFTVSTIIYHYNNKREAPSILASTNLSCIPNGRLEFDPLNKKSYIVKSNNNVVDKDVQVRTKPDLNVEDYGEE